MTKELSLCKEKSDLLISISLQHVDGNHWHFILRLFDLKEIIDCNI